MNIVSAICYLIGYAIGGYITINWLIPLGEKIKEKYNYMKLSPREKEMLRQREELKEECYRNYEITRKNDIKNMFIEKGYEVCLK